MHDEERKFGAKYTHKDKNEEKEKNEDKDKKCSSYRPLFPLISITTKNSIIDKTTP